MCRKVRFVGDRDFSLLLEHMWESSAGLSRLSHTDSRRLYLKCRILKHHAHRYLLPVCDRRAPVVVFRARRRARLSVRTAGFLSSDFTRTLRLLTSRVVVLVNPLVRARTAVCPKARPLTVCFHCSCEVCVRRYRTNNHTSHLRNKGCHKERVDLI